jgi:hypothetical protein
LKKLVEDLYQHIVPINEGYDFLFSDEIYVPVYETVLIVTKRTIMPISLVEEKILQLLNAGILQIDELSKILGLNRRLLEVTLADLYSKDLVAVSSNSCRIMSAGREALNSLSRTEKKQDILKNVCLDGILGNMIDASDYQLLNNARNDDNKLKPQIPTGKVEYYIERFKEISQIFNEENRLYFSEGIQPIQEELLKIDKVENTFVRFIRIPIHVYVSSNGIDIDVVAATYRMTELLVEYKDYIIEQLNSKKVLKNHFKLRKLSSQGYEGDTYPEKGELLDELKKIHYNKNKKGLDYRSVESRVLCNRKLSNGEYREILKYLSKSAEDVELFVDNLEDWSYNSNFTGTLADNIGKAKLSIYYRESVNEKKSIDQIKWNYNNIGHCEKFETGYYICWKIRGYLLYGIPVLRKVVNEDTNCLVISFYLKKNEQVQ